MATAQILFRVDLDTKAQIATAAKTQGVSINQWLLGAVAEALAAPPPVAPEPQTLAPILARLDALETLVAELTRPTAITDSTPTIIPSPPDPVAPPDPEPPEVDPVAKATAIIRKWSNGTGGKDTHLAALSNLFPGIDHGTVIAKVNEYRRNKKRMGDEEKTAAIAAIVASITTP
jgi:hypothetical protein